MSEIKFTYEWDEDLYLEATQVLGKQQGIQGPRSSRIIRFMLLRVVGVIFGVVGWFLLVKPQLVTEREILAFLLGVFFALWLCSVVARAKLKKYMKNTWPQYEKLGPIDVKLDASGIEIHSTKSESSTKWSAITEILEGTLGVYLILTGTQSLALPDKALPETLTRAELLQHLQEWHRGG